MINFADLNYSQIKNSLTDDLSLDKKKSSMRSNQIWKFYYQKGYFNLDLFSNLPKDLINELKKIINFSRPKIKNKQISKDGTIKWLLELEDKNLVETVYIPSDTHSTLCISSQVGCTLNCKFCHTGVQPLVKNLSSNEIINQIMVAKDELDDWGEQKKINNIVYMGMGEPFYNYENIKKSVQILKDENGLNFSNKKITISTSGISPNIKKAGDEIGTYLALSLHASNDEIRNSIMPINKKYNIQDIINHCNEYAKKNKEKSNIELQSLLSNQIQNALGYLGGQLSDSRTKSLEYYLGDKLGTEIDGRSQVVSTDVADTIESLLPNLLRVFTASDKVVHCEPMTAEDVPMAAQATAYLNHVFYKENDGFQLLYNFFKDALIEKNGFLKIYWDDSEKVDYETYENLSIVEKEALQDTKDEIEIVEEEVFEDESAKEEFEKLLIELSKS